MKIKNVNKKIIVISLFLIANYISAQNLELNSDTKFYEFSKIVEIKDEHLLSKFEKRLNEINIKNITKTENTIIGEGFTNHLVMGFATVEIRYTLKLSFKENKYKLTLTNFILTDKNGSNPLEGLRSLHQHGFVK